MEKVVDNAEEVVVAEVEMSEVLPWRVADDAPETKAPGDLSALFADAN